MRWSVQAAKGVETVAVKACGVLLRQEDQVCLGHTPKSSLAANQTAPCQRGPARHRIQHAVEYSSASSRCLHWSLDAYDAVHPRCLCLTSSCHLTQDAFHSEVAILKACRNKNIVAYIADYVDDERTWLIMEYMEVWPLTDNGSHGVPFAVLQHSARHILALG